jgi:hypothetical protein
MTIFFPDVSHYQAGLSLAGATAVIAKATEGTSFTDASYLNFRNQAAQRGIPFTGYHWVDSGDLQRQAEHAHSVLGATPTMWDAEAAGATVPRLVDLTNRYRGLGGNPRLVYLPHWFWQQLGSPDLRPLASAGLSLVSSNYAGYSDTGPGWAPYGGMAPRIWQYTDSQLFNGYRVDFNAYKGTVDDLRALLGLNGGGDVSFEDVIVGESQLYDQAANRSTPTGRNFANDFYSLVSASVRDEFAAVNAALAEIKSMLAVLAPGAPFPEHTHPVTGQTGPAVNTATATAEIPTQAAPDS